VAIRGVGTIFGDKQSGEVDLIGADLYLELLYNQLERIEKLRLNPAGLGRHCSPRRRMPFSSRKEDSESARVKRF
jgi:hypothetical protein